MSEFPRWPVTYYVDGQPFWQDESQPPPLRRGDGVIINEGRRYRVTDLWFSYDHHGHFNDGTHVFLTEVSGSEDDLPGQLAPSYFRTTPS